MEFSNERPLDPKIAEALALLQSAERAAASGQPPGWKQAVQQFEQAIARLVEIPNLQGEPRRWIALAWVGRGNVLRMFGPGPARDEALRSYDQAIAQLESAFDDGDEERRNDLADAWTNRGIALLTTWPADKLPEALRSFDEAIAQRRTLPAGEHHQYHYGLAATWMNRADVLTRMGGEENLAAGLQAYDEAIVLMRGMPFEEEDAFRHRLAAALMNRGITRQAQNKAEALREAVQGFDECIALLAEHALREHPDGAHLLACAWLNRAGAALAPESGLSLDDGEAAARAALAAVKAFEEQMPALAEIGLKSRHALCRALGAGFSAVDAAQSIDAGKLGEATDAVDDALVLARTWETRGLQAFRPLALELFRFGTVAYQRHQPHFLADFVLENLDAEKSGKLLAGNSEAARVAGESVWRALQDLQRRSFASVGKPEMARMLETLVELRGVDEKLRRMLSGR